MLVGQKRSMSLDRLFRVESGDSEQRLPPPSQKKPTGAIWYQVVKTHHYR